MDTFKVRIFQQFELTSLLNEIIFCALSIITPISLLYTLSFAGLIGCTQRECIFIKKTLKTLKTLKIEMVYFDYPLDENRI